MLCLLQAAKPGVPVIYAPVSSLINPRMGLLMSGAAERGLLCDEDMERERERIQKKAQEKEGF